MAKREGFEPPEPYSSSVFKTDTIDRSDTSPYGSRRWNRTTASRVRTWRTSHYAMRLYMNSDSQAIPMPAQRILRDRSSVVPLIGLEPTTFSV